MPVTPRWSLSCQKTPPKKTRHVRILQLSSTHTLPRRAGIDLIFISRFPRRFDITDEQDRDDIVGEIRRSHEKSKEQAEIVTSRMIARAKRRYMPPASVFGVSVCRDKTEDKNKWWLEVDQEKVALIREAGLAVLDGKSSSEVVALFDGHLTNGKRKDREASAFSWVAVKRLLTNPILVAIMLCSGKRLGSCEQLEKDI